MSAKKHFTAEEAKEIGEKLGIDWSNSMWSNSGWEWMSNLNMGK